MAALLLAVTPAAASDLHLWPLLHLHADRAAGVVAWRALGPLLEYRRTPQHREFTLRPLLRLVRERDPRVDRADVLFPLAALRREGGVDTVRLLLLSIRRGSDENDRLTLFPLLFWRRHVDAGSRFGLLPFYLAQDHRFGFDAVETVAFPLWLRVVSGGVERRFHPFPFVSSVSGSRPGTRGLRVWPLAGFTDIPDEQRTRFLFWPFWIDQERAVPGYGRERRRVRFPFWAALDGEWRHSEGWGVLAYTRTVDRRLGTEAVGSPWPLVLRERPLGEDRWRTFRIPPFWGRSEQGGVRSRFWLWPLLRATDQDEPDFHARRRDLALILGRAQWGWDEASGRRESLVTLLPLIRHVARDGAVAGQSPALVDALTPRNRGVLALWAPLWALLRWESEGGDTADWTLAWGLLGRQRGRLRGPLWWAR